MRSNSYQILSSALKLLPWVGGKAQGPAAGTGVAFALAGAGWLLELVVCSV